MSASNPNRVLFVLTVLLASWVPCARSGPKPTQLAELMPRAEDHTSMWWREGFPGVVEDAPWHRCIRTGRYAMVLDTETLKIPHLGPLPAELPQAAISSLPPAELELSITVDGKQYRCTSGGPWTQHGGPRLIESGRFFQRADVTDLVFTGKDGTKLNVEARFETAAWADRLALILAARPGFLRIPAGEASFGRVRGGFGLDLTSHFEIPAEAAPDSEAFTLEFWVFVPTDYQATKTSPWLVCKNHHEQADGNFGIMIRHDAMPQARLNIGGGRENSHILEPDPKRPLTIEAWNHVAISYDGEMLRLYANGRIAGEKQIGRKRIPIPGKITFGRRGDNSGDGYRFRGAVDEIRFYDRALTLAELRLHYVKPEIERPALKPVGKWTFRDGGTVSMTKPRESWNNAAMEISLSTESGAVRNRMDLPGGKGGFGTDWQSVGLAFDPSTTRETAAESEVVVRASELDQNETGRPVDYDAVLGWHRINLDGIEPVIPSGVEDPSNDAIERIKLVMVNPTERNQIARLMFEKTARGIRQRIGTPITGISAILRDREGNPTGIPVQLSKNWHHHPEGSVYSGQWFHGITQVRLPPGTTTELELTLAYGHWGGVPAASHSQLSLIGWGANQLWDQSALGSWGETICFEPDQIQRGCTIMDVRPLMVTSMRNGEPWGWTNNVGGGDFFRLFDPAGERIPHVAMQTAYHRQGPCLTEVTYAGKLGKGITHDATVSLARTDDVVRGVYRIRMQVDKPIDFSRLVIFQIGADTYSSTGERKMGLGDENGLIKEWETQRGGNTYRTKPMEYSGRIPWVSLHEAIPWKSGELGARANRGIVIRSWKARIGGKEASPWVAERGLNVGRETASTLDILPPPGVTRLESGDFVEAIVEHLVVPQFARDYYGPNEALRSALTTGENSWRMIHREAAGNDRKVTMKVGTLKRIFPDIRIRTDGDEACFKLTGGLGHVPMTFTGLSSSRGFRLLVDGIPVDQSVHGNDFWQTDHDPVTRTWSQTFNLPVEGSQPREILFSPEK